MGRYDKRLNELLAKQDELQTQLARLDKDLDKQAGGGWEQYRKAIIRELTDVKIRLRNMQRNASKNKVVNVKMTEPLEEEDATFVPVNAGVAGEGIEPEDECFNPEAVKLNTTRPEMRMYPVVPLPHAQPLWTRVRRVGRRREMVGARLTDWQGQFSGVEEEEERLRWQGRWEGKWNWNQMNNVNSRDDEFRSWKEDGNCESFCKLDAVETSKKSDEKESPEKVSPTTPDILSSKIISPAVSSAVQVNKQAKEPVASSKDLADLKSLFPLDNLLTSAPHDQLCKQVRVDMSSTCQSAFEDRKHSSGSTDEVFTKIKARVNEEMITKIKALVIQNSKDNRKPLLAQECKPCVVGEVGQKAAGVGVKSSSSEWGIRDMRFRQGETRVLNRTPHVPDAKNMVTVRAKLAPAPAVSSRDAAKSEPLREKLRKRLITKATSGGEN